MTETKKNELLKQPDQVALKQSNLSEPQPLPPIDDIIAKGRGEVPIYGIYCWGIDYAQYRDAITGIGFSNLRTVGITDESFPLILEDGLSTFATLGLPLIDFENEDAFIEGNIQSYLKFLRRYGPNGSYFKEHPEAPYRPIEMIEFYNEPNFGYMVPNATPIQEKIRLYSRLQITAYPRVKAEFPTVKLLGFGAGGAAAADHGFITGCIKEDSRIVDTMDVLTTHPYADWSPFAYAGWLKYSVTSCFNILRDILEKHGKKDMPIWYSELGWMIRPDCGGHFDTCHKAFNLLEQAAFTVQMYALGLRLGIERITNMYIMDTDNCNPGFVNRDGSWRPIAHATKTMIDLLPDPRLVGAIKDGEDNCYAYRFESKPQGEEILMVFSADERKTITLPWSEERVLVTDMLGNSQEKAVDNGAITLEIGAYPIYLRHIDATK